MKNTDIAMIILVAAISVALSYFLGNAILGNPNDRVEEFSYIETVSGTVESPDPETFNDKAINPTIEVYIGNCGPFETWNPNKQVCESNSTTDDNQAGDK